MLSSLADLRDTALAAPPLGATRIITVDGRSGSGKTWLATRLAALAGATLIHLDDLVPGWHALERGVADTARDLVEPLVAGHTATARRWDWEASTYAAPLRVAPGGTVLIEGSAATVLRALAHVDTALLVRVDDAVRLARLDSRADREAYLPWRRTWARQEGALARRHDTARLADLLVDGSAEQGFHVVGASAPVRPPPEDRPHAGRPPVPARPTPARHSLELS